MTCGTRRTRHSPRARSCWRRVGSRSTSGPSSNLAIVDVPDDVELYGGHRFAHEWVSGLHPMALYNATRGFTLLVRQGRRYELTYRYESWVQYRSRPVRARRDLGVLAAELSDEEPGDATWRYDGSGSLAPNLRLHGADESAIDPDEFLRRLDAFRRDRSRRLGPLRRPGLSRATRAAPCACAARPRPRAG